VGMPTLASYLGSRGFRSRAGDQLSRLRFLVVFLSPCRPMPGHDIKSGHGRSFYILSNPLFINHPSIRCYVDRATDRVIKIINKSTSRSYAVIIHFHSLN
jgi:hypothetical protein